ncbi:MAG: biopolymer transporter ExbD [Candidatus Saelkia tenebricola]|nr:biopolymer transporter ExbD [Candidatus Saelkia tenebricola]
MRNKSKSFKSGVFNIPRKTRLLKGDLDITPLIDCVFLLLIFFMLSSSFVRPAGINVNLPKTVTADILQEEKFVIIVSENDVIHLDNTPHTSEELKEILKEKKDTIDSLLIKSDKGASLGKIVEIWDICRELGIEKLNIATLQGKK